MSWYAARVKPGKEQQAAASLAQRGVDVWLPILKKRKTRAGRRDWEPLFPCYLFANLDVPSDRWLAVRAAPFVVYFLGQQGLPTAIPDEFIETLMARVAAADRQSAPCPFHSGERVMIARGPFQYTEALFDQRLSPSGRSRVLVQLLNRLVPIELPEDYLGKVG